MRMIDGHQSVTSRPNDGDKPTAEPDYRLFKLPNRRLVFITLFVVELDQLGLTVLFLPIQEKNTCTIHDSTEIEMLEGSTPLATSARKSTNMPIWLNVAPAIVRTAMIVVC